MLDRIFSPAKNEAQIKFSLNTEGLTKLDRRREGRQLNLVIKNALFQLETMSNQHIFSS